MEGQNIHISLDEAREEIKKRWDNTDLKKAIEEELGTNLIAKFNKKRRAVLWRQLQSPDTGFTFFNQCAHFINSEPLAFEYLGDKFVSVNDEKKEMGRLHLFLDSGFRARVNIIDFVSNENKPISGIRTITNELLVDFYHSLLEISKYKVNLQDLTGWCNGIGSAEDYYYPFLLHFVAHGVLFETFLSGKGDYYSGFTENIVFPCIQSIEKKFGLKPLVVKLYPEDQDSKEDFYWWSFPPHVNEHLIKYAESHNLVFNKFK
jgi:hypothetical protein